jgi:polar amino acid transport system substrate-binding protein
MLRLAYLLTLSFACACAGPSDASSADSKELTSSGTLRVGIGVGPVGSAFWAVRDEITGKPPGVTVDLAGALASRLAAPLELIVYANSGELISGAARGEWDVAFAPIDEERRKLVDFGPVSYLFESTYLVPGASAIQNIAEVDRPGVRVVGIGETTTARAAIRSLYNARFVAVRTVEEAEKTLLSGEADAVSRP